MWPHRNRNRRKPAERPAPAPGLLRRRILRSAAVLAASAALVALPALALDRPIETLTLAGPFARVAPREVAQAVETSVRGRGLLTVNLGSVRAAVEALPWVDTASVARSWLRGLTVRIVEQVPAARWADGGLVNTRGTLFAIGTSAVPPGLPELAGPAGSVEAVAERYFAMQARLEQLGLKIAALSLDARGAWQFVLADGVTVRLGRKRIDARFQTFATVAAKIVAARASAIAYVDMRYMNGFAIGWRAGGAQRKAKGEDT